MVGGTESVGSSYYQDQVSRENQIQRGQERSQEAVEETSPQQIGSDNTSFSEEALELARTAVSATSETPEATNDTVQMSQPQQQNVDQGTEMPGRMLDVVA